jgi:hypothetical protein
MTMNIRTSAQTLVIGGLLALSVIGLPAAQAHADSKGGTSGGSSGKSCYNSTTKRETPNGQVEYVPLGDGVHSQALGCDNGNWVNLGTVGASVEPPPTNPLHPVNSLPPTLALGS